MFSRNALAQSTRWPTGRRRAGGPRIGRWVTRWTTRRATSARRDRGVPYRQRHAAVLQPLHESPSFDARHLRHIGLVDAEEFVARVKLAALFRTTA